MKKLVHIILYLTMASASWAQSADYSLIETRADTEFSEANSFSVKTNLIPWVATVTNIGGEVSFARHWSVDLDVWFCPWKISDKYALKTVTLFPEVRWWLKDYTKGHYFDLHFSVGWFNLRFNEDRYQDTGRPFLGAGIGYGYRFDLNRHWGIDLNIGVGYMNVRYNRYYNIPNGALADTRITNYLGVDRIGVSIVYKLGIR